MRHKDTLREDTARKPVASASRRFRPAALPTVAAIVGIAVFVAAGNWQRGRMEGKIDLRARFDAAAAKAPVAIPVDADWAAWRYRPVSASGTFDARRQILIDNKIHAGRAGYHVVTPLRLDDGRMVLVNRGWVAAGPTRAELPREVPPSGPVVVVGRLNSTPDYFEFGESAPQGGLWQNLDPARFAAATGIAVLPVVVEQTAPLGDGDDLKRDWPAPDFGVEKHRIYMLQWYSFALLAAGLWLFFNLRRRRPT